jgi:uncharacterized protein YbjT (DUF2867 family)
MLVRDPAHISGHISAGEVAIGDFAVPESLGAALTGIERVFLASFDSPDQAELQGNLLTAAKRQGVRHIVRVSTMGVEENRNLPIIASHRLGERQLEQSGLAFTHLRPSWVMQNFLPYSAATPVKDGMIRLPAGDGRVGFVDARDVAAVAAQALRTSGHEGKAYELTGPEARSHADVAGELSAAVGRSITYENVSAEIYEEEKISEGWPRGSVDTMLGLFAEIRAGNASVVTDTVKRMTGHAPRSVRRFAQDYASSFGSST